MQLLLWQQGESLAAAATELDHRAETKSAGLCCTTGRHYLFFVFFFFNIRRCRVCVWVTGGVAGGEITTLQQQQKPELILKRGWIRGGKLGKNHTISSRWAFFHVSF